MGFHFYSPMAGPAVPPSKANSLYNMAAVVCLVWPAIHQLDCSSATGHAACLEVCTISLVQQTMQVASIMQVIHFGDSTCIPSRLDKRFGGPSHRDLGLQDGTCQSTICRDPGDPCLASFSMYQAKSWKTASHVDTEHKASLLLGDNPESSNKLTLFYVVNVFVQQNLRL